MKYDDYMMNEEYMGEKEYVDECEGCEGYEERTQQRNTRMIEVEEVLGTGSADTIVEICVPLCPPAFSIEEQLVTKEVEFDALVATKGKVFINGRIIKDIPYKTRSRVCFPKCQSVSKATYGDLRHVTVEVPFALCINVPEAFKGAKVVVLEFDVTSIEIPNHTNCLPNSCVAKCDPKPLDICNRRVFCSLTEKDCIWVKVKVVKDTIINVPTM